jgi:hypothetical protein
MDMAFDLDSRSGAPNAPGAGHPSWPALLARMVAAREVSLSLARENGARLAAEHGSFDEGAAACMTALAARRGSINPNDLGNGKSGGAIASPVAGVTRPGGRGQK